MQLIFITGNLGRDPELKTTQNGDQLCAFSVGVKQGWGDRQSTNWFRCTVWGKRAETIKQHLYKGSKVTVAGELLIGEYEGKPQYDVRVTDVDWVPRAGGDAQPAKQSFRPAQDSGGWDDDSEVPF